jgi:hypothetical protein
VPLYNDTSGPPWLQEGESGALIFTLRLAADANLDKLEQGIKARMPGIGTPTALPYIGADRVLSQGPNESAASFASRLSRSFDTWDKAGSKAAVLEQLWWFQYNPAIVYPSEVPLFSIVNSDGTSANWATLYSTSDPTAPALAKITPTNWNWDGLQYGRRAWLFLYFYTEPVGLSGSALTLSSYSQPDLVVCTGVSGMSSANVGQYITLTGCADPGNNGTWQIVHVYSPTIIDVAIVNGNTSDANNGSISWTVGRYPGTAPSPVCGCPGARVDGDTSAMDGEFKDAVITCGLTNPPDMVGMQALVRLMKSASTWYPWFTMVFGGGNGTAGSEFSPNSAQGAGNPDGTWETWAKNVGGVDVYARSTGVQSGYLDAFCDGTGFYVDATVPTGT